MDKAGEVWTLMHAAQVGKLRLREERDLHSVVNTQITLGRRENLDMKLLDRKSVV